MRAAVVIAAVLVLLANRPLSVGLILGTAACTVLALLVLTLLERPAQARISEAEANSRPPVRPPAQRGPDPGAGACRGATREAGRLGAE